MTTLDVRDAPVRSPRRVLIVRIALNVVAAFGAALFARAGLEYYLRTHSLIGGAFFAEELWIVLAYLIRRRARVVSQRPLDWLLAFGGTFGGVLLRPSGAHPHWGVVAGFDLQMIGLTLCVFSFLALGRSFGFAAADRGLVQRGPYLFVRHPIYASYFFLQVGYLLQSLSVQNALIILFICGCNIGRAVVEERLLVTSSSYEAYRRRVPWRLMPGVW
ncbi:MAG: isoprenylcysteine carboxylmethyltransferase family protein [Acidimicrobiales bacterium]